LDRLLAALGELEAIYRGQGGRRLTPEHSHLASPGHQLLTTRAGWLDVLGAIGDDLGYEDFLPRTVEFVTEGGVAVRMLDLPTLIAVKEQAGRDKDKAALPVLRNTLAEQRRSGGESP
jgi:hypothetical protein